MLGFAIINYNTYQKTIEAINSIENTYKGKFKIYLLDNNSTNESVEILRKAYENDNKVIFIESKENLGYAKGNNLCMKKAILDNCNYCIVCNNDIIFKENSINILFETIAKEKAFAVGPKIFNINSSLESSIKIKRESFIKYFLTQTKIYKITKIFLKKDYSDKMIEVYWLHGSCFIVDLLQMQKIGFFDPYTFLYYEEYILAEKALKNKLKMLYQPDAEVIHHHGATIGQKNIMAYITWFKSELYYLIKYRHISTIQAYIIYISRLIENKVVFSIHSKRHDEYMKFKKNAEEIYRKSILEFGKKMKG